MRNNVKKQSGWCAWFDSTIGRKQLVGVTGVGLSLFVLQHMLANMMILFDPRGYNEYSHALISNKLIYVAEAGLVGIFLVHVFLALKLTWQNWRARSTAYAVLPNGAKRTTWTQRSLWAQGSLILVFVQVRRSLYGRLWTRRDSRFAQISHRSISGPRLCRLVHRRFARARLPSLARGRV
jgi:succinate dehydrogenase/fumarate reductase cytochrome b subunit